MLQFQKANSSDFAATRQFYWDVIEDIHKNNTANENLGWEKGVYPSDDFIQTSLEKGELYTLAEQEHKKAVRLDVLGACKAAEALYRSCGFAFVAAKNMYYEDTGWTEYRLFERNLPVEPMPDM